MEDGLDPQDTNAQWARSVFAEFLTGTLTGLRIPGYPIDSAQKIADGDPFDNWVGVEISSATGSWVGSGFDQVR